MSRFTVAVALALGMVAPEARGQGTAAEPFAVEYYYRIEWGHFDEWMELYKRNHYPILERQQERGEILEMRAAFPRNHASEESRWDFRFTIVWKDALVAHRSGGAALAMELYPDQETFRREEQRRFQLLIEHIDVPVREDDLSTW